MTSHQTSVQGMHDLTCENNDMDIADGEARHSTSYPAFIDVWNSTYSVLGKDF